MLNKLLVRINNINELSYLKEKGINNFLFPLDGFSIGYNTFKIEQIKDLDVNIYLLVNRVFDNDTLNNWNNIKEKLTFAKGIFFEDIAVYMTTKNIPLIFINYAPLFKVIISLNFSSIKLFYLKLYKFSD